MKPRLALLTAAAVVMVALAISGCGQSAPTPAPTSPPAAAPAPAKAVAAPTAVAQPTAQAVAQPTAAPAKKLDYPAGKAITFINPWPAGGAVDLLARILAPNMEKTLGTSIQVVNKAGSSGMVGVTDAIRSKPDGYTMVAINQPTTTMTYIIPDFKAAFARKDLIPVALFSTDPFLLGVKSDGPYKTMKDFVDAAKASPGKITVSDSGAMGSTHFANVALAKAAGVQLQPVHFEGGPPSLTAVLGGHVDAVMVVGSVQISAVRSGQIRPLGVMDSQESKFFPGLKTMEAQGYKIPAVAAGTTTGLAVPAATPKEIVDILSIAIKTALADPNIQKKMDDITSSARYMDPTQYAANWDAVENDVKTLMPLMKQ